MSIDTTLSNEKNAGPENASKKEEKDRQLYEIVFEIMNPNKSIELDERTVRNLVDEIEYKRQQAWMFMHDFSQALFNRLSIHPVQRSEKPVTMRTMRDYWEYVHKHIPPSPVELNQMREDTVCKSQPERTILDIFGKPGVAEYQKTRLKQAEKMPFDGYVIEGIMKQPLLREKHDMHVLVTQRHKTVPRTIEKVARKIAEEEAKQMAQHGINIHPYVESTDVIRHDPIGMKLTLFDKRLVLPLSNFAYKNLHEICYSYAKSPYRYKIEPENNYPEAQKKEELVTKDHAIHYDIIFSEKRYRTCELIITSKYDFWIDEFCGENSHHRYMSVCSKSLNKKLFEQKKKLPPITDKLFKQINNRYHERVIQLLSRGDQFLNKAQQYASDLLRMDVNYYFPVRW